MSHPPGLLARRVARAERQAPRLGVPVAGGEVLHLLRDRDRVVGEALVVAAREGRIDRVDGLALPRLAEHLVEDLRCRASILSSSLRISSASCTSSVRRSSTSWRAISTSSRPISANVGRSDFGTTLSGNRYRASCAMWVDMSPMRSSEALMRSALTTMRRSRATGCCRARIVIASSSSATVSWSMWSSSAMTSSARLTWDSLNARVALSIDRRRARRSRRAPPAPRAVPAGTPHACFGSLSAGPAGRGHTGRSGSWDILAAEGEQQVPRA